MDNELYKRWQSKGMGASATKGGLEEEDNIKGRCCMPQYFANEFLSGFQLDRGFSSIAKYFWYCNQTQWN